MNQSVLSGVAACLQSFLYEKNQCRIPQKICASMLKIMQARLWVSFLSDKATYELVSIDDVPLIPRPHGFEKYVSRDDLLKFRPPLFPTSMRMDLQGPPSLVCRDDQGHLQWHLNDDGSVGLVPNCPETVVANTLGDFLARIDLETRAWRQKHVGDLGNDQHAMDYLASGSSDDIAST